MSWVSGSRKALNTKARSALLPPWVFGWRRARAAAFAADLIDPHARAPHPALRATHPGPRACMRAGVCRLAASAARNPCSPHTGRRELLEPLSPVGERGWGEGTRAQ